MLERLTRLIARSPASAAGRSTEPRSETASKPSAAGKAGQPPARAPAGCLDNDLGEILTQKILMAWLRNRHQLLFPQSLRRIDVRTAGLAREAAVAAARADGATGETERRRLARLDRQLAGETGPAALAGQARPLDEVLAEITDVETASVVYAACLLASDRRVVSCRLWLRYLAARLALPDQLASSLEQRYATE